MSNYVKEYQDRLRSNLLNTYSNAREIVKSESLEAFEKGRGPSAYIGEVRIMGGVKWVKTHDGWVYQQKGGHKHYDSKTKKVSDATDEQIEHHRVSMLAAGESPLTAAPKKEIVKPTEPITTVSKPVTIDTKDLSLPEVQKLAIHEIAEKFGKKAAYEAQAKLKAELIEKYGFTIKDKWDAYETRLKRLMKKGTPKAVMAYGTGGIGKTFTFEKVAKECGMRNYDDVMEEAEAKAIQREALSVDDLDEPISLTKPPYDYVVLSGKSGSQVVQRAMYEHRDKIIVFDDCDSMWENKDIVNVFKAALDTSGEGRVQWAAPIKETEKGKGDFVPSRFKFAGRMIFITNLSKAELSGQGGYADARPITESRASSIDLTMNMDETLERLTDIKDGVVPRDYQGRKMDVTDEDKQAALDTLKDIKDYAQTSQMNTRTLSKVMQEAAEQREENGRYDKKKLMAFMFQELGII